MGSIVIELPPVRPARIQGQAVVLVEPPGSERGWIMTPEYARETAALLIGAALAVEKLNEASQADRCGGVDGAVLVHDTHLGALVREPCPRCRPQT